MNCCIDREINNINLQNIHLKNIVNNNLITQINTKIDAIPQTKRIIYFNKLIANLKNNLIKCKRNTLVFITPKDLDDIYIKQNGKCALSKKNLTFNYNNGIVRKDFNRNIKKINDFNVSISRIDNNSVYNKDNIQLIACRFNLMKNTLSNGRFIDLCKKVVKNYNYRYNL
jgi:hypothetical protein